jgi:ABC-2 type transport system ATP-binding protein
MEQVFQSCILEQKTKGKGVFLSSHIMSEVERLCDRVAIIRDGTLAQTGTIDELRHMTRYTMLVTAEKTIDGIEKQDGIYDIEKTANGLRFHVDACKMGAVINYLTQFGIQKLESTPPSLEDLFMQHYTKEGAS